MKKTRRMSAKKAVILMAMIFALTFFIGLNIGSANLDIISLISQTISGDHDSHYSFNVNSAK